MFNRAPGRALHKAAIKPAPIKYLVMVISVADEDQLIKQIRQTYLPTNWRSIAAYPVLIAASN
jgi:hypothetical protein